MANMGDTQIVNAKFGRFVTRTYSKSEVNKAEKAWKEAGAKTEVQSAPAVYGNKTSYQLKVTIDKDVVSLNPGVRGSSLPSFSVGKERIKPVANSKDVLYFKTSKDAEKVAKANNWKTPIVRYFDKGYAIQRNVSGAYFGAHNDDATKAVTKNALDKAIAKQNKIDEKRAAKGLVARSRRYVFGK